MRVVAPLEEEHYHQVLLMEGSKTLAVLSPFGEGLCKVPPSLQMDICLRLWMNLCGTLKPRSVVAHPHDSYCLLVQSLLIVVWAFHAHTQGWAPSHFLFAMDIDIFD